MINDFSFKELYEVSLKTTQFIEVGGRTIEPGETIALFDNIQVANFQEIKSFSSANGGFDNRVQVFWDSTKEVKISLTQGVFSKTQLALMTNAKFAQSAGNEIITLSMREVYESDSTGEIVINKNLREPIFIYDSATGEKIKDWTRTGNTIYLTEQYKEVVVDYNYDYDNGFSIIEIGKPLTSGFLSLTGKMRVKDDTTGKVVTGIIKIPKLRLMSDLSMRVGSDAIPQVGRLDAVAVPEGVRGQSKVMEIIFLNDDIDADM